MKLLAFILAVSLAGVAATPLEQVVYTWGSVMRHQVGSRVAICPALTAANPNDAAPTLAIPGALHPIRLYVIGITPQGAFTSATSVRWSSGNKAIVTVDSAGNVRGVSSGQTWVRATTAQGSAYYCMVSGYPPGTVTDLSIPPHLHY